MGAAVFVLVALAAYQPAWRGAPLWDDDGHLTRADLRDLAGLGRIWTDVGATQQYYPLVHSAFWAMHRLWGDEPVGYHLATIVLHALAGWLAALVLVRLAVPLAWGAALLFVVHPIQVESVAWITEMKNTLSGVLYFAAALAWVRFDRTRSARAWSAVFVLFLMGLLAKSVTATLPASLLVVAWWRRGSLGWRRDVVPLLPLLVLGVASAGVTTWVEARFIGASEDDFPYGAAERALIAGRAAWFYAAKFMWPWPLIFTYPRWTIDLAAWWQWLFPIAALGAGLLAWRLRNRSRAPLAVWLLAGIALAPALGFVNVYPFRFSFVADHFAYLAVLPLAAGAVGLAAGRLPARAARFALAAVVGLAFGVSWIRAHAYVSAEALYRDTIHANPSSWMAHHNLGLILVSGPSAGHAEGIAHIETALVLNPNNAEAHNSLGIAHQRRGRLAEARRHYEEARRLKPALASSHNNLGAIAHAEGRWTDAIAHYRAAVRLEPQYAEAHRNLGLSLQAAGRLDDAIVTLTHASDLDPLRAVAHDSLATALLQAGRPDQAVGAYRRAIALDPENGETHNNLGIALARLGRLDEALEACRQAERLLPREGRVHYNMATTLHSLNRLAEAIDAYRRALTLGGSVPRAAALNDLGVALATAGRLPEAIAAFTEALREDPGFADARANLGRATRAR
jgi:tetratricopeptide (TPR) repeat protein